eukprot:1185035-Prorocentrum_minimum.AAC.3
MDPQFPRSEEYGLVPSEEPLEPPQYKMLALSSSSSDLTSSSSDSDSDRDASSKRKTELKQSSSKRKRRDSDDGDDSDDKHKEKKRKRKKKKEKEKERKKVCDNGFLGRMLYRVSVAAVDVTVLHFLDELLRLLGNYCRIRVRKRRRTKTKSRKNIRIRRGHRTCDKCFLRGEQSLSVGETNSGGSGSPVQLSKRLDGVGITETIGSPRSR